MQIQTATINDVPDILELQHKAFLPVGEVLNWLDAPNITETIETALEAFPNFTVLKMVVDDGKIVGSVRGKVDDGSLFIGRLMVLPEYQRNGYAKELLHKIQEVLPHNRVWLETTSDITSTYTFYEREGFRTFKTEHFDNGVSWVSMAKWELHTNRILLRPWREDDVEALYKYASDPVIGTRAGWPPHKNIEDSTEVLRNILMNDTTWAIILRETGEPIGSIGYMTNYTSTLPSRPNEPLVGYWVSKPYWNKGICTEALNLMIKHIRAVSDYKSLISSHFVDNPASGRVMQKCGFVPTGETCIDSDLSGMEKPMAVLRLEFP